MVKNTELALAGKSNVMRWNGAFVVMMNAQRLAEEQPSTVVEPNHTPKVYVSKETGPDTNDTSFTKMYPAPDLSSALARSS